MKQNSSLLPNEVSLTEYHASNIIAESNNCGDEKSSKLGCLHRWMRIVSYKTNNYYWITFIFIVITICLVIHYVVEVILDYDNWYDHIGQCAWIVTTYIIWAMLHYNLNYKNIHIFSYQTEYNTVTFYGFISIFIFVILSIRFITFAICIDSAKASYLLTSIITLIAAFITNLITMYTLDFLILYLCLSCIYEFNKLKKKIIYENDVSVDEIKSDLDEINKNIISMKSNWEFVVSISCFYHILFATVSIIAWLSDKHSIWIYCGNDTWTSLCIVIIRGIVRIFGLIYGIVRLNTEPRKLAKVINTECNWKSEDQAKINRMVTSLTQFSFGFKVFRIKIEWKHFCAILVAAITASLGSLLKSKLEN